MKSPNHFTMNLSEYISSTVNQYQLSGSYRTAETYLSTFRSMLRYHGCDAPITTFFTSKWLAGYRRHLLESGLCQNSIVFYMLRIRCLHRRAVRSGLLPPDPGLFQRSDIRTEPTRKRAVLPGVIRQLAAADLSMHPGIEFTRDMFLLSFYLQGISFVDLAHLRPTDLRPDGTLVYRRRKTGSTVTVAVDRPALELIARYRVSNSPYIVPILFGTREKKLLPYQSALRTHNRRLKALARLLNIKENLTSYVSRHTWATVAYHKGVATSVISQAMGHKSEEVTHIYLKSFDRAVLLRANRAVADAVFGACTNKPSKKITDAVFKRNFLQRGESLRE